MNTFARQIEVFAEVPSFAFGDSVNFFMRQVSTVNGLREIAYGAPVQMVPVHRQDEGAAVSPTFCLKREGAQQLMDQLWRVGLRPSEGSGSAGALAATERHLDDMRALVFKTGAPGGGK